MTRLLVIPNEFPLPGNSGGRIDVWRRMQVLHDSGVELGLLTWYDAPRDGAPESALLTALHAVCKTVHLTPIRRNASELLQRALRLGRMPSHIASRWVTLDRAAALAWATEFAPSLILLDGLYGVAVARWLAGALGVPWIYRSHNIEHHYMRFQWDRARSLKQRAGLAATIWGLEDVECATVRDAAEVLDISQSDAAYWQRSTQREIRWLPTVVDGAFAAAMAAAATRAPTWDLLYFGNLNSPNNVEAVRWLVRAVLPLLGPRALRIALAGSGPNAEVRELAASDARITLLADPPAMATLAGAARVLVNPVQAGSGMNLKSVEMLFSNTGLVSTPAGVQGMPEAVMQCFAVAGDAPGFAALVQRALDTGAPDASALALRAAARAPFQPEVAAGLLAKAMADACAGVRR
jgi:polysaccharide biosynthesis protein PslH